MNTLLVVLFYVALGALALAILPVIMPLLVVGAVGWLVIAVIVTVFALVATKKDV